MNVFVKSLHGKPYDEAVKRANITKGGAEVTDDMRAQIDEALKTHPGNPAQTRDHALPPVAATGGA